MLSRDGPTQNGGTVDLEGPEKSGKQKPRRACVRPAQRITPSRARERKGQIGDAEENSGGRLWADDRTTGITRAASNHDRSLPSDMPKASGWYHRLSVLERPLNVIMGRRMRAIRHDGKTTTERVLERRRGLPPFGTRFGPSCRATGCSAFGRPDRFRELVSLLLRDSTVRRTRGIAVAVSAAFSDHTSRSNAGRFYPPDCFEDSHLHSPEPIDGFLSVQLRADALALVNTTHYAAAIFSSTGKGTSAEST